MSLRLVIGQTLSTKLSLFQSCISLESQSFPIIPSEKLIIHHQLIECSDCPAFQCSVMTRKINFGALNFENFFSKMDNSPSPTTDHSSNTLTGNVISEVFSINSFKHANQTRIPPTESALSFMQYSCYFSRQWILKMFSRQTHSHTSTSRQKGKNMLALLNITFWASSRSSSSSLSSFCNNYKARYETFIKEMIISIIWILSFVCFSVCWLLLVLESVATMPENDLVEWMKIKSEKQRNIL